MTTKRKTVEPNFDRLKRLREEAFRLQEKFQDDLVWDGESLESQLQKKFSHFLYEIDQAARAEITKNIKIGPNPS